MATSTIPKSLASDVNTLNSSLSAVIGRVGTDFRVLNINNGTGWDKVLQDIVANIGTLTSDTMIVGIHRASGARFFVGYLYTDKTYGACLCYDYTGSLRFYTLNNGTYSTKTISS